MTKAAHELVDEELAKLQQTKSYMYFCLDYDILAM